MSKIRLQRRLLRLRDSYQLRNLVRSSSFDMWSGESQASLASRKRAGSKRKKKYGWTEGFCQGLVCRDACSGWKVSAWLIGGSSSSLYSFFSSWVSFSLYSSFSTCFSLFPCFPVSSFSELSIFSSPSIFEIRGAFSSLGTLRGYEHVASSFPPSSNNLPFVLADMSSRGPADWEAGWSTFVVPSDIGISSSCSACAVLAGRTDSRAYTWWAYSLDLNWLRPNTFLFVPLAVPACPLWPGLLTKLAIVRICTRCKLPAYVNLSWVWSTFLRTRLHALSRLLRPWYLLEPAVPEFRSSYKPSAWAFHASLPPITFLRPIVPEILDLLGPNILYRSTTQQSPIPTVTTSAMRDGWNSVMRVDDKASPSFDLFKLCLRIKVHIFVSSKPFLLFVFLARRRTSGHASWSMACFWGSIDRTRASKRVRSHCLKARCIAVLLVKPERDMVAWKLVSACL